MDKTIKIAIYVAVLFFASIWISSVIKSCNAPAEDLTEVSDAADEELDEFEENFFEENLGEDDENTYDSDMGGGTVTDDNNTSFDTDYTEIDEALEEKTKSTSVPKTTSSYTNTNKGNSYGKYMVLAGSYLIKDNASSMIGKLNKIGYNNAEIVVFNMSQYHSVCAARLNSHSEAMQLSRELKRKGIDSYVHTKH